MLLVEDDLAIADPLARALKREGHEVVLVTDGRAALKAARRGDQDLIVLDLGLPDGDGLDVCRALRADRSVVPILILTARADEMDVVVGLQVGADDYVTKPFRPRELVARIKTVLRRSSGTPIRDGADRLVFPGLVIDVDAREVTRNGRDVALSTLEFDLLAALARAPGRVLSRRQLLEQVWGFDFFGDDRVVDVHIRSIRKELGDSADNPELIGTVRGVGYKFLGTPE